MPDTAKIDELLGTGNAAIGCIEAILTHGTIDKTTRALLGGLLDTMRSVFGRRFWDAATENVEEMEADESPELEELPPDDPGLVAMRQALGPDVMGFTINKDTLGRGELADMTLDAIAKCSGGPFAESEDPDFRVLGGKEETVETHEN